MLVLVGKYCHLYFNLVCVCHDFNNSLWLLAEVRVFFKHYYNDFRCQIMNTNTNQTWNHERFVFYCYYIDTMLTQRQIFLKFLSKVWAWWRKQKKISKKYKHLISRPMPPTIGLQHWRLVGYKMFIFFVWFEKYIRISYLLWQLSRMASFDGCPIVV